MSDPYESFSPIELATLLFTLREQRVAIALRLKEVTESVDVISKSLLAAMLKDNIPIECNLGTLTPKQKSVAAVYDQESLSRHILETGSLDLLQNRISEAGCRARWEIGDTIPGVKRVDVDYLSISTKGKKS